MTPTRRSFLAARDAWKSGLISHDAAEAVRAAFEASVDGAAYFSGPMAPADQEPVASSNSSEVPSMGDTTMTVDRAAWEELKRRAAEAPALIAAAGQALAPPAQLSGPPAAGGSPGELPEEAWAAFNATLGLPYSAPRPGTPAALSASPIPSESDLDRFVASLPGFGRR